ncbi:MAG: hypothetical protein L7U87_02745 [Chlamydiales bacterium]|nr:hypothetical protein [Chlamydiales bacterium]
MPRPIDKKLLESTTIKQLTSVPLQRDRSLVGLGDLISVGLGIGIAVTAIYVLENKDYHPAKIFSDIYERITTIFKSTTTPIDSKTARKSGALKRIEEEARRRVRENAGKSFKGVRSLSAAVSSGAGLAAKSKIGYISFSRTPFDTSRTIPIHSALRQLGPGETIKYGLNNGHNVCWLNSLLTLLAQNNHYDKVFFPDIEAEAYPDVALEDEQFETLRRSLFALIHELRDQEDHSGQALTDKKALIASIQQTLVTSLATLEAEKKLKGCNFRIGSSFNDPAPYISFLAAELGAPILASRESVDRAKRDWPEATVAYEREILSRPEFKEGDDPYIEEGEQASFNLSFSFAPEARVLSSSGAGAQQQVVDVPATIQKSLSNTDEAGGHKIGAIQFTQLPQNLTLITERAYYKYHEDVAMFSWFRSAISSTGRYEQKFSTDTMPTTFELPLYRKDAGTGEMLLDRMVKYKVSSCTRHLRNAHFTSLHLYREAGVAEDRVMEVNDRSVIKEARGNEGRMQRMLTQGSIYVYKRVEEE